MIYIVIPVHNRKNLTRECLMSLFQQDMRDFEIVVVDDGSSDGTHEVIHMEFPNVSLLQGDGNLWWAGSINEGIRYCLKKCKANDYILTLNDDLIVSQDYLSSLTTMAEKYPSAIIGSVETTSENPTMIKSGGVVINWKTAKEIVLNKGKSLMQFPSEHTVEVSSLTGRGTLYPSKVFREVGLFDERQIKQCADTELPIRAKLKFGYQLMVSYRAVVISHVSPKETINDKKYYQFSDIREYFFDIRSHFNLKNRFWIAWRVAPNIFWFFQYFFLNALRTIGHYVIRLKI